MTCVMGHDMQGKFLCPQCGMSALPARPAGPVVEDQNAVGALAQSEPLIDGAGVQGPEHPVTNVGSGLPPADETPPPRGRGEMDLPTTALPLQPDPLGRPKSQAATVLLGAVAVVVLTLVISAAVRGHSAKYVAAGLVAVSPAPSLSPSPAGLSEADRAWCVSLKRAVQDQSDAAALRVDDGGSATSGLRRIQRAFDLDLSLIPRATALRRSAPSALTDSFHTLETTDSNTVVISEQEHRAEAQRAIIDYSARNCDVTLDISLFL
jgi:hypothetical protein